jgi:hypothetical protein
MLGSLRVELTHSARGRATAAIYAFSQLPLACGTTAVRQEAYRRPLIVRPVCRSRATSLNGDYGREAAKVERESGRLHCAPSGRNTPRAPPTSVREPASVRGRARRVCNWLRQTIRPAIGELTTTASGGRRRPIDRLAHLVDARRTHGCSVSREPRSASTEGRPRNSTIRRVSSQSRRRPPHLRDRQRSAPRRGE